LKLFLDNNLPPRLAKALSALFGGLHEVVALRDKFPQNISDKDWITQLSKEGGWSVLSSDRRILKNPTEKAALRTSNLTAFFLTRSLANKTSVEKQMIRILQLWEVMETTVKTVQGGAAYELPERSTRLKQLPY